MSERSREILGRVNKWIMKMGVLIYFISLFLGSIISYMGIYRRNYYLNLVLEWIGFYDPSNEKYTIPFGLLFVITFFVSYLLLFSSNIINRKRNDLKLKLAVVTWIFLPIILSALFFSFFFIGILYEYPHMDGENFAHVPILFMILSFYSLIMMIPLILIRCFDPEMKKKRSPGLKRVIFSMVFIIVVQLIIEFMTDTDNYEYVTDEAEAIGFIAYIVLFYNIYDFLGNYLNEMKTEPSTILKEKRKKSELVFVFSYILNIILNICLILPVFVIMLVVALDYLGFSIIFFSPVDFDFSISFYIALISIFLVLKNVSYISMIFVAYSYEGKPVSPDDKKLARKFFFKFFIISVILITTYIVINLISGIFDVESYFVNIISASLLLILITGFIGFGIYIQSIYMRVLSHARFPLIPQGRKDSIKGLYLALYNRLWNFLHGPKLWEEYYNIWLRRGYVLVIAFMAFWSIEPSIQFSTLVYPFWGAPKGNIGFIGCLLVSFMFIMPMTLGRTVFGEDKGLHRYKDLIISVFFNVFLIVLMLTEIGPFEIESHYYREGFDIVVNYRRLWILFSGIILASFLSIRYMDYKIKKRIIVISTMVFLIMVSIVWNLSLNSVIGSDDDSFWTKNYPFSIPFFILAIGIVYTYLSCNINKNEVEEKTSRLEYIKRVSMEPIRTGIIPFSIIVLLIPISYVSIEMETWHGYCIDSNLPDSEEDREFALEILSTDLGVFLNISQDDYHYHPKYVDMSVINSIEAFVKDKEKNYTWGNYWVSYSIAVARNVTMYVRYDFDEYNIYQHDLYREGIIYLEAKVEIDSEEPDYLPRTNCYYQWMDGSIFNSFTTNEQIPTINISRRDVRTDVVIISLVMDFGEQTAPLAGYGCHLSQSICLIDNEIIYIGFHSENWIS